MDQISFRYARACFVGQERFIAVASSGNDLCILDAQDGNYLQGAVARGHYHHSYNQHSNPVFCIAAHPLDTKFLTGSDDHKVRYCEILNRPEDWMHFRERQKEQERANQAQQTMQQQGYLQGVDGANGEPSNERNGKGEKRGSSDMGKGSLGFDNQGKQNFNQCTIRLANPCLCASDLTVSQYVKQENNPKKCERDFGNDDTHLNKVGFIDRVLAASGDASILPMTR